MSARLIVAALLIGVMPAAARAQSRSGCDYATCALRIVPRLRGLDVVRGDDNAPAGSLGFLWPSASLARAFESDHEAEPIARASIGTRRTAALLTDAGALVLTAALARSILVKRDVRPSVALGIAGAATLAISIPVQFAADEQLSRAVHTFNRRFAR